MLVLSPGMGIQKESDFINLSIINFKNSIGVFSDQGPQLKVMLQYLRER